MTVAPRPVGLLWVMAFLAGVAMLGAGGYFLRHQFSALPKNLLPFVVGAVVGVVTAAILLRLIVRLIARFDLAFLEALLATIYATSLVALAAMPIALSRLGMMPAAQAARILPVTGAVGLLLILIGYAYAIHTAQGRRIGIGRGIIVFLLQLVSVALLAASVVELVKRLQDSV